ncbi:MAG: Ldh family oxidoreductase [Betaproteobacteria bacterium]|nr:Ldh family oxidoreductase [Betaproteobacteria bacterium]
MEIRIHDAIDLAERTLTRYGMRARYARMTAEHLVDAALCGHEFASLPRLLAIVEELRRKPPAGEAHVVRENERSAVIDGGDNVAYAVSVIAVDKAIELARKSGIAVVGVRNTWFSGRLAYYVERAARQGFVAMHTTNTTARVAPYGGIDRLFGTNPFAIAFPANDEPLVVDFGTAATTWGETILRKNKGELLPDGVAVDAQGSPTRDPDAALAGAFLPWGGHRGYAMSLVIQLLALLAGSEPVVKESGKFGLFFLAFDPGLLMPADQYKARVTELRQIIKATRPAPGAGQVRVPGDASLRKRKENTAAGVIRVDDRIYSRILALLDSR